MLEILIEISRVLMIITIILYIIVILGSIPILLKKKLYDLINSDLDNGLANIIFGINITVFILYFVYTNLPLTL